jgi:AAA family ATP:ADP antiporter
LAGNAAAPSNPLKALAGIRREELPLALLMFSYLFLVITTFWINKTIKKSLFVEYYDRTGFNLLGWQLEAAQAELLAKVCNMFVAAGAVVVFSVLSNRLRRHRLTLAFSAAFAAAFVLYSLLIPRPSGGLVWSFYLFGDLYSTIMVAGFFAFLNDSVTPGDARRLYGLIVLGGVGGGAFGSLVVYKTIETISDRGWMLISVALTAAVAACAAAAGRLVERRGPPSGEPAESKEPAERKSSAALEGARLVLRSPYLLAIVALVGLYEILSTLLDFQFTTTISHFLNGPAIGRQFSLVFTVTNATALGAQLLLTTWLMTRFRLVVPLLVTPIAIMAGSGAFLLVPILWTGSLLNTVDNAFAYSVHQSAREALYTPTTREEKYKAKAFIDMFVQRFAKALAVGIGLLVTSIFASFETIRYLSLFTLLLALTWGLVAVYAGRKFHELSARLERESKPPV